jgi:hypothetical protein
MMTLSTPSAPGQPLMENDLYYFYLSSTPNFLGKIGLESSSMDIFLLAAYFFQQFSNNYQSPLLIFAWAYLLFYTYYRA